VGFARGPRCDARVGGLLREGQSWTAPQCLPNAACPARAKSLMEPLRSRAVARRSPVRSSPSCSARPWPCRGRGGSGGGRSPGGSGSPQKRRYVQYRSEGLWTYRDQPSGSRSAQARVLEQIGHWMGGRGARAPWSYSTTSPHIGVAVGTGPVGHPNVVCQLWPRHRRPLDPYCFSGPVPRAFQLAKHYHGTSEATSRCVFGNRAWPDPRVPSWQTSWNNGVEWTALQLC